MAAKQAIEPAKKYADLSLAMQQAQSRLVQLQEMSRARRAAQGQTVVSACTTAVSPPPALTTTLAQLPPHLGWHSTAVSHALRRPFNPKPNYPQQQLPAAPTPPPPRQQQQRTDAEITLHPSLAIAMLRHNLVTSGRIWLLLRHLDTDGRGWFPFTAVHHHLTTKDAPLRICGKRQLRNLLREGDGRFWERRNGRLWLRSLAKVAAALQVGKLNGRPVAMPVAILTKPIGTVRAHFYASFHSGRQPETAAANPIARDTIAAITSISPRIQRRYEARAGVRTQTNIAIGPQPHAADSQEMAWQHGHAARVWTDSKGTQGTAGTRYWVWQLPNSYHGPHTAHDRRAQKRINRTLTDLPNLGTAGNGQRVPEQRFFANGRIACAATSRPNWTYWQGKKRGSSQQWHPIAPEKRQ